MRWRQCVALSTAMWYTNLKPLDTLLTLLVDKFASILIMR